MPKVLFVCLGNICRSPLAEALFLNHLRSKNLLDEFQVDSCGTAGYHIGELADSRTRKIAKEFGIEMPHRARQFQVSDFDLFDFILVMDESNLKNLEKIDLMKAKQVLFLRNFDPLANGNNEVPDPYYGDLSAFYEVHEMLNRCTESFLDFILYENGK
ncbi:MAG: low molecular weight protein-tyrosine-phosphatase [Bacteroidia bacterium]